MAGRQGQIQGMNRALASRLPRTDAASARIGAIIGAVGGGWLADRFGTRRLFVAAIVLFSAGSLACAPRRPPPSMTVSDIALARFTLRLARSTTIAAPTAQAASTSAISTSERGERSITQPLCAPRRQCNALQARKSRKHKSAPLPEQERACVSRTIPPQMPGRE